MSSLKKVCSKFFKLDNKDNNPNIACLENCIGQFCESGSKEDAFLVYFCFCEVFSIFGKGYDTMSKLLELLFDHENHSGELLLKHRDHYSHSVYVFVLGIAIYTNNSSFKNAFIEFYKNENFSNSQFLYLWGITALFHDIGYPFQLAHEQVKSYVNELWGNENNNPYISYNNMDKLLLLSESEKENDYNAKDINELFAAVINLRFEYDKQKVLNILNERYSGKNEFLDHGYFSALLLIKQLMDAKTKLELPVLDGVIAILLHNSLNRYDIAAAINLTTTVNMQNHPLTYLLILCDELQNWDRTAFGLISKKDPLAWNITIDIGTSVKIKYIFDSEYVYNLSLNNKNTLEKTKRNKNLESIKSGCFIKGINALVSGIKIEVGYLIKTKNKKTKNFASSNKFINLCDFAKAIHKSYQSVFGGDDFDKLPLEYKVSNIEQAKSYAEKLELINCFYSEEELDYPIVEKFSQKKEFSVKRNQRDDLGFLAREEHLRWVREKLYNGWRYGTNYKNNIERNKKHIHKDIIPYDFLPENEKKKDILMVKNMIPFLYQYGHGVRIYSYREGRKPVLEIAGCGHRIIMSNKEKLKKEIKAILKTYQKDYRVIVRTCFAFGADQLISEAANELGITIKAVLPFSYEKYITIIKEDLKKFNCNFTYKDELNMRHLLAQTVSCKVISDNKYDYYEAAKYVISRCDKLIALWDGVETILKDKNGIPVNQGGTWHSIYMAKHSRGLSDKDIHIIHCER